MSTGHRRTSLAIALLGVGLMVAGSAAGQSSRPAAETKALTGVLPKEEAEHGAQPDPRPLLKPLAADDLPPPNVFSARGLPRAASLPATGDQAWRRGKYGEIVEREAQAFGVPPELVDAVMAAESSYNPATVGASGEVGLMQLMPATAAMLGFTGTLAELAVPEANIHYGVRYLAAAWQLAGHDICTATMKYRAGHGETRFSYRSVDYCIRVRAHLSAQGYPVTGTVPLPTFGQPTGVTGRARGTLAGAGRVDLDALNAQLRELTERVAVRTLR
jgi:hypothetical protein